MAQYIVTGPVVVLPDATTGKTAYYYQGAVLPDGLNEDRVADVLSLGLVDELQHAEPANSSGTGAGTGAGAEVPAGSADEVLAWVGDDSGRARAALAAEQQADKPRTTLVDKLAKLAGQA